MGLHPHPAVGDRVHGGEHLHRGHHHALSEGHLAVVEHGELALRRHLLIGLTGQVHPGRGADAEAQHVGVEGVGPLQVHDLHGPVVERHVEDLLHGDLAVAPIVPVVDEDAVDHGLVLVEGVSGGDGAVLQAAGEGDRLHHRPGLVEAVDRLIGEVAEGCRRVVGGVVARVVGPGLDRPGVGVHHQDLPGLGAVLGDRLRDRLLGPVLDLGAEAQLEVVAVLGGHVLGLVEVDGDALAVPDLRGLTVLAGEEGVVVALHPVLPLAAGVDEAEQVGGGRLPGHRRRLVHGLVLLGEDETGDRRRVQGDELILDGLAHVVGEEGVFVGLGEHLDDLALAVPEHRGDLGRVLVELIRRDHGGVDVHGVGGHGADQDLAVAVQDLAPVSGEDKAQVVLLGGGGGERGVLADLDLEEVAEQEDGEGREAEHQPDGATPHVGSLPHEPPARRRRRGGSWPAEGGPVLARGGGARRRRGGGDRRPAGGAGRQPVAYRPVAVEGRATGTGAAAGATPHTGPPKTPRRAEPSSPSTELPDWVDGAAASSVAGGVAT